MGLPRLVLAVVVKTVEAPDGFEPSNGGFADLSLSHLGTAP